MSKENSTKPINIHDYIEKTAPATQETSTIQLESDMEQEKLRQLRIENDVKEENKKIRRELISALSQISFLWLLFTAVVIWYLSDGLIHLSDTVAIAFITSSLATVVGLWLVGLNYFFSTGK